MTLKFGWYGDDFTGATDTLAAAAQGNLRCLLFLDVPTERQLAQAGELDALGIAGSARTMRPPEMADALPRIGEFFKTAGVSVLHYKCCSTFDSSTHVGSIGVAASILNRYVSDPVAYVVGGQPGIGRYCCFSTLFASAGAGRDVVRLDRHPTMKQHPVTPMDEADLRLHLARQWEGPVAAVHYPAYDLPGEQLAQAIESLVGSSQPDRPAALLFDVADASDLGPVGRQIWGRAQQRSILAVGPSSVVQALAACWEPAGQGDADDCTAPVSRPRVDDVGAVFVFAGSMSGVTARQVRHAGSYLRVPLRSVDFMEKSDRITAALDEITRHLDQGLHVLAYVQADESAAVDVCSEALALITADFVKKIVDIQAAKGKPIRRLGVAGGDTSSRAVQALPVWALSFMQTLSPGVALCRAHSDEPALNGMELMLKGGQMGPDDIFQTLLAA